MAFDIGFDEYAHNHSHKNQELARKGDSQFIHHRDELDIGEAPSDEIHTWIMDNARRYVNIRSRGGIWSGSEPEST